MTEDDMVESVPRRVRKTDLKLQVEEELVRFIKHMDWLLTGSCKEEELARMLGVSVLPCAVCWMICLPRA